jgi:hypothetical protein
VSGENHQPSPRSTFGEARPQRREFFTYHSQLGQSAPRSDHAKWAAPRPGDFGTASGASSVTATAIVICASSPSGAARRTVSAPLAANSAPTGRSPRGKRSSRRPPPIWLGLRGLPVLNRVASWLGECSHFSFAACAQQLAQLRIRDAARERSGPAMIPEAGSPDGQVQAVVAPHAKSQHAIANSMPAWTRGKGKSQRRYSWSCFMFTALRGCVSSIATRHCYLGASCCAARSLPA